MPSLTCPGTPCRRPDDKVHQDPSLQNLSRAHTSLIRAIRFRNVLAGGLQRYKMVQSAVVVWTPQEQAIAREAFERAHDRAVDHLISKVKHHVQGVGSVDSLWQLHDYLSTQRHDMEGRFDFRLEGILFVFANFVKDGLLGMEELTGLEAEKLAKIKAMALF